MRVKIGHLEFLATSKDFWISVSRNFWEIFEQLTGCQTKIPTPSYNQVERQWFLRMAQEEYETWPNIDEFEIYQKSNL